MKSGLSRRDFIRITAVGAGILTFGGIGLHEILKEPEVKTCTKTRLLLGTFVTIKAVDTNESKARMAVKNTFDEIERLSGIMSRFDPGSQLYSLNKTGTITGASQELVDVAKQALEYSELTNGAFDVTVLPMLELNRQSFARYGSPPDSDYINQVKGLVDYRLIGLKGSDITLGRTGASITLDSIAKGYIVDMAAELLQRQGDMDGVMVEAGGDMYLSGTRQDGNLWKIGIAHPRSDSDYWGAVSYSNGAMATSGDYESALTGDYSYHHIIDPRAGMSPLELSSATVLAGNTAYADALATACIVMGRDEALAMIEKLPGVEALLIDKDMKDYRTSGFPAV